MELDLVVVGAGPAGSMAARAAARGGLRVALIDKKRSVGEPVQCAEGVSRFALESNGLRPDPAYVRQEVRGAKGVVPCGKRFAITTLPGFAVDRAAFDRSLADLAVREGARLFLNERITSMRRDGADGDRGGRAYDPGRPLGGPPPGGGRGAGVRVAVRRLRGPAPGARRVPP